MSNKRYQNLGGNDIVIDVIKSIQSNKDYLSELDGAVGDGDHGVNMSKGASIALPQVESAKTLTEAFGILSSVLMDEIGGSMGPLYGSIFMGFEDGSDGYEYVDGEVMDNMLQEAYENVTMITKAKVGDKSLIDVLDPAVNAYHSTWIDTHDFEKSLEVCELASEVGMKSTINLQARIGRASRLGEMSIGHQDAGATSCCIIIQTLCNSLSKHLVEE